VALLRWKICCRQITVMVSWFRYTQPNRTITEVGWPNPTNGPNYTHYDGHDIATSPIRHITFDAFGLCH
jgi:hypothetical protein